MTDRDAFLRTIAESPDDDAPRLVFADWLDEQGEAARAEFIRLQCDLAVDRVDSPARRRKAFRMRQLRDGFDQARRAGGTPWAEWGYGRGLVDYVGMTGEAFADTATHWFSLEPIRRLWLCMDIADDPLPHIPATNCLTALDLCGSDMVARDLAEIDELTTLGGVRELGLMFCGLGDDAVPLLCELPYFQRLTRIDLGGNPFTEGSRERLREHFGDRVRFVCERRADHLYTLIDDPKLFRTGWCNDHTQMLLAREADEDFFQAISFDHEGRWLSRERCACPVGRGPTVSEVLLPDRTFTRATIRIKRFRQNAAEGIYDFDDYFTVIMETPGHPERTNHSGWTEGWLLGGQFTLELSREACSYDRDGDITATTLP